MQFFLFVGGAALFVGVATLAVRGYWKRRCRDNEPIKPRALSVASAPDRALRTQARARSGSDCSTSLTGPSQVMTPKTPCGAVRLVVLVEGKSDIEFLKTMSAMFHAHDPQWPDLTSLEERREVILLPTGGGDATMWIDRLAGLNKPEFHLYDRDLPPVTARRRHAVDAINRRDGCIARLTGKRTIENYLHKDAIWESCGLEVTVNDWSDIPKVYAQTILAKYHGPTWDEIPYRGRKRLRDRSKKTLLRAAQQMTPERLAERDPEADVLGWMRIIARLLAANVSSPDQVPSRPTQA